MNNSARRIDSHADETGSASDQGPKSVAPRGSGKLELAVLGAASAADSRAYEPASMLGSGALRQSKDGSDRVDR